MKQLKQTLPYVCVGGWLPQGHCTVLQKSSIRTTGGLVTLQETFTGCVVQDKRRPPSCQRQVVRKRRRWHGTVIPQRQTSARANPVCSSQWHHCLPRNDQCRSARHITVATLPPILLPEGIIDGDDLTL